MVQRSRSAATAVDEATALALMVLRAACGWLPLTGKGCHRVPFVALPSLGRGPVQNAIIAAGGARTQVR
jgi:hypothetical protein